MDLHNIIPPKYQTKSFWSLMLTAMFLFAIYLSYTLITHLFQQSNPGYAHKKLSLPQLDTQKSDLDDSEEEETDWTTIEARSGDSLATLFKRAGISYQILQAILKNNPHAKLLTQIKPNQKFQLLIQNNILEQMIVPISNTQFLVLSHQGGLYKSSIKSKPMTSQTEYVTATVKGSLYNTAKRQNIPYKLIRQMTDLFNWEIDFIRDIRPGDQFTIVYEANYIDDKQVSIGDIIAVSYTNHDVKHQAIRHVNASGDYDYFNPQGISLKKAFSRYPVKFSHISSTYSLSRKHPILHYNRPHKGVDLAASIGTPVYATGDGRIEIIDRQNGYGNMIKISHSRLYASVYGHLLRFQKGLSRGDHVKRGQLIGYVGQTGLATGPHCHYEFHVNHQPKNPTTIELPRASPIPARDMAAFKMHANTILAQLQLYETASLAAKGKKSQATV